MIQHVHIENFRGIRSLDITPQKNTIFLTGMNGSGKTSVLYALRMALFGRCALTSRDGKGAGCLVRDGAKMTTVGVKLEHGRIDLTISAKGGKKWTGILDGKAFDTPNEFWNIGVGMPMEYVELAADPMGYLVSGEIGGVLSEALSSTIDQNALHKACGEHWPNVESAAHNTVDELKRLGESAYEHRAGLTSRIRDAKKQLESQNAPELPIGKDGKPITIDRRVRAVSVINQARASLDALVREKHRAETLAEVEPVDTEALQAECDKLRTELAAKETQLKSMAKEREALTAKHAELMQVRTGIKAEQVSAESELKGAERELAKLKDADTNGNCPTCGRAWTKKAKQEVMAPTLIRVNDARESLKKLMGQYPEIDARVAEINNQIDALKPQITALDMACSTLSSRIIAIESQIAQAKPAENTRPVEIIQAEIDATQDRIEKGVAIIQSLDSAKAYQDAKAQLAQWESEHAEYDWIVKAFKDGVVLNALMQDSAGDFLKGIQHALKPHGYTADIQASGKKVYVFVGRIGKTMMPFEHASKGEQCLLGLSIAREFAGVAAPIMVDDLDGLDGAHKPIVFQKLGAGQSWVSAAWGLPGEPDVDAIAKALNAHVVHIKNGEAVEKENAA